MPLNIFICYKKVLETTERSGIVYRSPSRARLLHKFLSEDKEYSPWIDDASLITGMAWETEIYERILISDLLLLLIERGTSQSDWVKREIALARALGISVLPLGSDMTRDEMVSELKELQIDYLQGRPTRNLEEDGKDSLLRELRRDLLAAAERTRKQQKETLKGLLRRSAEQPAKAPDCQSAATFRLANGTLRFHVASGDIAQIRDVDVFVNSENDFMQMARVFDGKTISATLRRMGSRIREGRYEDTIQQELDRCLLGRHRPVLCAEVFVTSAGGSGSELADNNARYIFHVAAVQVVPAEARLTPFSQPHQIRACARAVLTAIARVNSQNGVISPEGTDQRAEQEQRFAAGDGMIRSVIFPLFGTGQGGSKSADVLAPMMEGILGALEKNVTALGSLSDIYISAYTVADVEAVSAFLRSQPALVELGSSSAMPALT